MIDICSAGRQAIQSEIDALISLKDSLDKPFEDAITLISECTGHVIITGVGKSGHIGGKIAATMSSLGTPSFFLHPDDALHGDLGMITRNDIVIAISNSGESEELLRMLPNIKIIGAKIIGISSNQNSTLAKESDVNCHYPKTDEACILGLAPTSSTTATLALGDAMAVVLSQVSNLKREEYAIFHPAGTLGKKLTTKISDIMRTDGSVPVVYSQSPIKEALIEITKKELGAVCIVEQSTNRLLGIITDGDLRRKMDNNITVEDKTVDDIMTANPIVIQADALALDALLKMQELGKKATVLPVVDGNNILRGLVSIMDIIDLGITC